MRKGEIFKKKMKKNKEKGVCASSSQSCGLYVCQKEGSFSIACVVKKPGEIKCVCVCVVVFLLSQADYADVTG